MENNNQTVEPVSQPTPPTRGRGFLMAHITNLVILIGIFLVTHYYLASNNCTPEVAFRVSVIAAILYGLLSTMLVISWVHRKRK
jgi:hypothetical protein